MASLGPLDCSDYTMKKIVIAGQITPAIMPAITPEITPNIAPGGFRSSNGIYFQTALSFYLYNGFQFNARGHLIPNPGFQ